MGKKKPTIVALDKEQVEWLDSKVEEGYSKSGLIRHAVKRLMADPDLLHKEREVQKKQQEVSEQKDAETGKPAKKVEIERILEVLIEMGESGKLDELGVPNIVETAKHLQEDFNHIDSLSSRSAFELGKFKVEMETMFDQAMQKHDKAES